MTAWAEAKPDETRDRLMWQTIAANIREGPQGQMEMTLGLQLLAAILLVRMEGATGQPLPEILQDIAAHYLL